MSGTQPSPIKIGPVTLTMPPLPIDEKTGLVQIDPKTNLPYIHVSSNLLAYQFGQMRDKLDAIVKRLAAKVDGETFDITFQFNFTCNTSAEASLKTDKDTGTVTFSCYCNGPG